MMEAEGHTEPANEPFNGEASPSIAHKDPSTSAMEGHLIEHPSSPKEPHLRVEGRHAYIFLLSSCLSPALRQLF